MAESEDKLKSLLMKVKEEHEKADLKLSIQKTKIMASIPITSWQIDGETMETGRDFIFLGSKITADGNCSHGWHHQLYGHEFEQALRVGDGQGSLACCNGVTKSRTRLSD